MIPGMYYKAPAQPTAVSAECDIFEITAPADAVVVVTRIVIGQSSDYGDAAAEGLRVRIIRGHTTSGSGGSAVTPVKGQTGFAAAGTAVEIFNTTIAANGTAVVEHDEIWNVQIGFDWRPTPEEYIVLSPNERLVVRVPAPTDALTIGGTLYFTELGG